MNRQEAEETIGRAARIDLDESERMRVEDVVEAAQGVGISEASVHAAIRVRGEETVAASQRRARRQKAIGYVAAALSVLAVVTACDAALTNYKLSDRMTSVEQKRADVRSAIERQRNTIAMWSAGPFDADRIRARDSEVMGSENRVRIAIHRYDLAASRYNRYVDSTFWMPSDFPRHTPLSNEVTSW